MRKIALVFAVLLLLLTGCRKEPDIVTVPGYQIHLNVNGIWSVAEESDYDLEMNAGDLQIRAVAHMDSDFAEPVPAEELYASHNKDLQGLYASLKTVEEVTSYTKDTKTIWTSKYISGEKTIYSCMVSFGNEAGSSIWIALSGPTNRMDQNIRAFLNMVEGMTCDAESVS